MTNKTTLELNEHYVDVKIQKDSMVTNKVISYENIATLFQQDQRMETPYLPGEYGLQKISINGNREYYMYLEPAREVTTKYQVGGDRAQDHIDYEDYSDDDEYDEAIAQWNREHNDGLQENRFISPALLWMVALRKRGDGQYDFVRTHMYAMKSPIFTGKESVYDAPFSNIYEHGDVCWNEVAVRLPTPKAIQGLSTLFFGGIGNTDLDRRRFTQFDRSYLDGSAHLSLHFHMEVNEMLKDEDLSPQDVLDFVHSKLSDTDQTVDQAFESFKSNY